MVKKYVCMKEGCNFIAEDEALAFDHADATLDHPVVVLELKNHTIRCEMLHVISKETAREEYEESI